MSNLFDYLTWRGDLTLDQAPWTLVDSLIMASFCYNDVGPNAASSSGMTLHELAPLLDLRERKGNVYFEQWRDLLYIMADTSRFGGMRVHDYIDEHSDVDCIQFSAMTIDFDHGPNVVAFRGTDASIVGWREDCNMAFETVPAQLAATAYLQRAVEAAAHPVIVVGHSKGGNLSAYAAAHVTAEAQSHLTSVCSFDGPGLDDATLASDGYARICGILTCMIPQGSVVGRLLGYHKDYMIVHSTALGLIQHDAFTWQLVGPHFEVVHSNDLGSNVVDRTVRDWLAACTPEARRAFVDALFGLVEPLHASTTADLTADKLHTAAAIVQASREMDPESRHMFNHMLGQLLALGAANTRQLVFRPLADALPPLKPLSLPIPQGGKMHES